MSTLYRYAPGEIKPRQWSFFAFLISKHPAVACYARDLEPLLGSLTQLPNDWWPHAAKIAAAALETGGIAALRQRLCQTFNCFGMLADLGLHFRARTASASYAWESLTDERRCEFGEQSSFTKYLIQQRELVARELLILSLPSNYRVSAFTRGLWADRKSNMQRMMSRTVLGRGSSRTTLKKLADSKRRKRAAEYMHISDELADYYIDDCGYFALWCTYTLPPEYHPGGYAGATDGPWLAAGCKTPEDGCKELMKRHRRLHDACRDSGITPHGRWDVQAHEDGTGHIHEVVFFISKTQADEYRRHAARIFPESRGTGGFSKRKQAAVIVQLETAKEAQEKLAYAGRHRFRDLRPTQLDNGERPAAQQHADEIWGELWEVKLHRHFGQLPLSNWRLLQELNPRLMESPEYRATLPAAVLAVWDVANGPERSYRRFLHLTEPTAPSDGLRLMFKPELTPGGVCIALIDPDSTVMASVSLNCEKWERLQHDDESSAPTSMFRIFLHLDIGNPMKSGTETPPTPKPFEVFRRRRKFFRNTPLPTS